MIKISGNIVDSYSILSESSPDGIEKKIFDIMNESNNIYWYDSVNQLKFELSLRKSLINASKELSRSRLSFRVFRKSKCNQDFWQRTGEGGFLLQSGVKPSDAIKDIYINSQLYGTECSTAMLIVYYKALVDILPESLFNRLFSGIQLMNWQYIDPDLGIVDYNRVADYLPGDARYFKNPDVDPVTPEWQGENVFDLGNGTYYGHGLGISDADGIINELNKRRISGSTVSAYLLPSAKRPNFKYLANKYYGYSPTFQTEESVPFVPTGI